MSYYGKSWCRFLSAKVLTITLGLAVFLWGTQYKISLYFQANESHPTVPTAKLVCPENNPFALAEADGTKVKAASATLPHAFSFVVTTNASASAQPILGVGQRRQHASRVQSASFIHFASLPPPASIVPTSSI